MKMKVMVNRAIGISATMIASPEARSAVISAFALLFWNEPGFSPSEFHVECDAARARRAVKGVAE